MATAPSDTQPPIDRQEMEIDIACVGFGIVYWGNRWTARKYWLPRQTELEAIVSTLKRMHGSNGLADNTL